MQLDYALIIVQLVHTVTSPIINAPLIAMPHHLDKV